MNATSANLVALLEQLEHKTSAKRRSAAKKLRRMQVVEAGLALIMAVEKEMQNPRTWETQYHMIMALGESGVTDSLPLLRRIATMDLEHTMVLLATGDATTRLEHRKGIPYRSLLQWLANDEKPLVEGSFRAIALLHLSPGQELIDKIISYASAPDNEQLRFWVAAACPGWDADNVSNFLKLCLDNSLEDTRRAAKAALEKKYLKWRPL